MAISEERQRREAELTRMLGSIAGKVELLRLYAKAKEMPEGVNPPVVPFLEMIPRILGKEFPGG